MPRDGKSITVNHTIDALGTALNINEELSEYLFSEAITTNPSYPNALTFSLKDLVRHNNLEHDASLSRVDYYFGNPQPFNQTIFDQTRSYWIGDTINVTMAANARYARVQDSNTTNPTFELSELGTEFGYGESAAYIIVLGDKSSGTVEKQLVEYLFENERLPIELGWSKVNESLSMDDLEGMIQQIMAFTPGETRTPSNETKVSRRGCIHNGSRFFA